jgi:hypothetical protein
MSQIISSLKKEYQLWPTNINYDALDELLPDDFVKNSKSEQNEIMNKKPVKMFIVDDY